MVSSPGDIVNECGKPQLWMLDIQVVKFNKKLHITFPPTRSCPSLPPLEMSSLASVMNNNI